MNVAIEARGLNGRGGIRTYVYELLLHITRQKNRSDIQIWNTGKGLPKELSAAKHVSVPLAHELLLPWWLNVTIPQTAMRHKPDVLHFTKADVPHVKRVPTVVTIYDVIPLLLPSSQSFVRRQYWPRALARAVAQSDHIITISESSKQGIVETLGASPSDISVTPMAVDTTHFKPTKRRLTTIPNPYILFVGQRDPKKNLKALIHAFSHIAPHVPHTLVLAGRAAHKNVDVLELARRYRVQDRVQIITDVAYEDLPALYSGADVFVFPSIIEGWGFPPHEAMSCGTPVIVSNADPLPEVVGSAGAVVPFSTDVVPDRLNDTMFVERLANEIGSVLGNPARRNEMSQAGLVQASKNTWEAVARNTLDVYRKVHTI